MKLPTPLIPGRLVRRYKRFLADVELTDGRRVTAHTPNTGSMQQCALAGSEVLLSASSNPQRKLPYSWELVKVNDRWVDINTHRANRVVEEGLHCNLIADLSGYEVLPEFRFGESRLDFLLENRKERVLVEVKNVTLCCRPHLACFPDAVTLRGQKHLRELMSAVGQGYRSVIFFLVQRGEAQVFAPADEIDPEYGRLLRQAAASGVEVLAYRTVVDPDETRLGEGLKIDLSNPIKTALT